MPVRHSIRNINKRIVKKIGIITLFAAFILQSFSQEVTAVNKGTDKQVPVADTNEITKVVIGQDLVSSERNDYSDDEPEDREKQRSRFRGHWAGVDFGFNNYLTSDNSFTLPASIDYMTLHSGKSMNFNLNFAQLSLGFTRHFGIVTGLGFNWNNYRFDGNNNIRKGTNDVIEMFDPGVSLKKSKLATFYLNLPLLLEVQIPADHNQINIAAGPIGGVKLSSHSKMVFEDGDKIKSDDDFSLLMLRYGGTARVGFGNLQIYGTYYLTPLFKSGKSPAGVELYPFEIGIAFTFND